MKNLNPMKYLHWFVRLNIWIFIIMSLLVLSASGGREFIYGTAEQLIMFQNEGLKYSPDIVLSTWHYTDHAENNRSRLYKVENGALVKDQASYLPGVKQREILFQYSAFKFIADNSHFIIGRENALQARFKSSAESVGTKHVLLDIPKRKFRTKFTDTLPPEFTDSFNVVNPIPSFLKHPERIIYWENSHDHFTPFGCELVAGEILKKMVESRSSYSNQQKSLQKKALSNPYYSVSFYRIFVLPTKTDQVLVSNQ